MSLDQYKEIVRIARELVKAEEDSVKACMAVGSLHGASRARSTTAEARWSRAAEYRDRIAHQLHVAVVRAGIAERFPDSYYGEHQTSDKWYPILVNRERP